MPKRNRVGLKGAPLVWLARQLVLKGNRHDARLMLFRGKRGSHAHDTIREWQAKWLAATDHVCSDDYLRLLLNEFQRRVADGDTDAMPAGFQALLVARDAVAEADD